MPKKYLGALYVRGQAQKVIIEKVIRGDIPSLVDRLRVPEHVGAEWTGCYDSFCIPGQPELDKINYFLGLYKVVSLAYDKLAGVFVLGNMAHHQMELRNQGALSLTLFGVKPLGSAKGLFYLAIQTAARIANILSVFPCYRTLQGDISPRLVIEYGITAKDPEVYSFVCGESPNYFAKYRVHVQTAFFPYFWETYLFSGIRLSYQGPFHMCLGEGEALQYSFSYLGKRKIRRIIQIGDTFLARMQEQNEIGAHIIWPDLNLKSLDSLAYFL